MVFTPKLFSLLCVRMHSISIPKSIDIVEDLHVECSLHRTLENGADKLVSFSLPVKYMNLAPIVHAKRSKFP